MSDDKKNIFYKPQLNIEKNYLTDGVINKINKSITINSTPENETQKTKTEVTIDTAKETIDTLLKIRKILPLLPDGAIKTVQDIVDALIYQSVNEVEELEKVKDEEDEQKKSDEAYKIYENAADANADDGDEDDAWPEMTASGFNFKVETSKDIWDLAYDQMLQDSTAIKDDFATKLNDIFQDYIYKLVPVMGEAGVSTPEYLNYGYEGESVTGIPTDMQHLNDIIVRNQDAINEYSDLFKKTHDNYATNTIITALDIVTQERIRYLKENFGSETKTYFDMCNKRYLESTRDTFDTRYKEARNDFYKYLNGTAAFSKDILNLKLDDGISKCGLLSQNVNIYAKKELAQAEYTNTASSKLQDLTASASAAKDTPKNNSSSSDSSSSSSSQSSAASSVASGAESIKTEAKNTINSVRDTTKELANGVVKTVRSSAESVAIDFLGSIATSIENAASKKSKGSKKTD